MSRRRKDGIDFEDFYLLKLKKYGGKRENFGSMIIERNGGFGKFLLEDVFSRYLRNLV